MKMKYSIFISTRYLLILCNLMLLACGILLVVTGFILLCDWPKVLLSRLILSVAGSQSLPQPPLYYVALVMLGVGLILCSAAVLGCWSACVFNYCILTITFLIVISLLLGECIMYGMMWIWPNCLGLSMSPTNLARTLQRSYSKAGFEQYTAAVDLAQSSFKCCGIQTSTEYDTSLWRLQSVGRPVLAIPLTCCLLSNLDEPNAYLDPSPFNNTQCQMLELEHHRNARHIEGCFPKLEKMYKNQYILFLVGGFVIILVEFSVLLSILLACTKVHKYKNERNSKKIDHYAQKVTENIYENERPDSIFNTRDRDAYTLSRSFRQNYRITDKP